MQSIQMQRAATDDFSIMLRHHEVADVLRQLGKLATQKGSIRIKAFRDGMDIFHVREDGVARTYHGSSDHLAFPRLLQHGLGMESSSLGSSCLLLQRHTAKTSVPDSIFPK